jgi:hypothetical protein
VNWRRVGNQILKNYLAAAWTETVAVNGQIFTVNFPLSFYNVSLLEDVQAAVTYVTGDSSFRAQYFTGGQPYAVYTGNATVSGFMSPWSNTETVRLDAQIIHPEWQMTYQVRPSVSVFKTLQYSRNEPQIISFDGNYREVTQNRSGIAWDIFIAPFNAPSDLPMQGMTSIAVHNLFEQLPTVDLTSLRAHPAAADIHKLFSMGIIDSPVSQFVPSQSIRRADFVTMLVKAVKIPIEPPQTGRRQTGTRGNTVVEFTFPDVLPSHPQFPYIMAAYNAGLVSGRAQGLFYPNHAITREEVITIMINALGLTNLGLDPVTHFADDERISDWAKRAVYAARRIGLITGDANGNLNPRQLVTKAEAAAFINGMIEYMRTSLIDDFSEHIVGYVY